MKKRFLSALLALTLLLGTLPSAFAAQTRTPYEAASALYTLGLFQGKQMSADGTPVFALADTATRAEAVTMLVRLLGKEDDAKAGTWSIPFTDVPAWAAPYVGYAYQNGLTVGTDATHFGSENTVSLNDYLTFLLRALGYSDAKGDFTWSSARVLAGAVGLLDSEPSSTAAFVRGDLARISFAALNATPKSGSTLLTQLSGDGTVTGDAVAKAGLSLTSTAGTTTVGELTAEQVYARFSPAVFYIELYDANRQAIASGSGFFISSDGKAVTNYHVIDGASYAKITLSDGTTTYDVKGVYDYDATADIALLQVNATNVPYLSLGTSANVVGGATVYAIGSPLGLSNTISQGIISNVSRTIDGANYIQTTAAISSGSSGGALITASGKVIGVTAGTIEDGQSLNMAVPITKLNSLSQTSVSSLASVVAKQSSSSTTSSGQLSASSNAVALSVGGSATVTLSQSFSSADSIDYVISDRNIARVKWGEWSSNGSTLPVTITGLSTGQTTVTFTLYNQSGRTLGSTTVKIIVS